MTLEILRNVMSDSIIRVATLELREWEYIDRSLVEMGFEWGGIECTGRIKRRLKEIKDSFSLFDDPEFSLVQYKPFIEKLDAEIQENFQKLVTYEFEDGERSVIQENKPSNYSDLVIRVTDEYVDVRNTFREGTTISDFRKIEGFDPDITPYLARIAKRGTKLEEEFLRNCTIRVWEQNDEVFGNIEPNYHKLYPDLKNRVCEAVYTRFKEHDLLEGCENGEVYLYAYVDDKGNFTSHFRGREFKVLVKGKCLVNNAWNEKYLNGKAGFMADAERLIDKINDHLKGDLFYV